MFCPFILLHTSIGNTSVPFSICIPVPTPPKNETISPSSLANELMSVLDQVIPSSIDIDMIAFQSVSGVVSVLVQLKALFFHWPCRVNILPLSVTNAVVSIVLDTLLYSFPSKLGYLQTNIGSDHVFPQSSLLLTTQDILPKLSSAVSYLASQNAKRVPLVVCIKDGIL